MAATVQYMCLCAYVLAQVQEGAWSPRTAQTTNTYYTVDYGATWTDRMSLALRDSAGPDMCTVRLVRARSSLQPGKCWTHVGLVHTSRLLARPKMTVTPAGTTDASTGGKQAVGVGHVPTVLYLRM